MKDLRSQIDWVTRSEKRLKEELGITEFVLWSNMGGMPPVRAENSIRLAWEQVAPFV